jgi:hypothetical protein
MGNPRSLWMAAQKHQIQKYGQMVVAGNLKN